MATSVLDQAIARVQAAPSSSATPSSGGDVLDAAISRALGNKPAQPPPLTPEQALSRTNRNMTLAMSGQQAQMAPEDQEQFEQGKEAGMSSAAVTAATGTLGGALGASSLVKSAGPLVPAGRDAAGRMLPWIASQIQTQGPSLAKQGITSGVSLAQAHPIAAWGASLVAARLAAKLGLPLRKVLDLVVGTAPGEP